MNTNEIIYCPYCNRHTADFQRIRYNAGIPIAVHICCICGQEKPMSYSMTNTTVGTGIYYGERVSNSTTCNFNNKLTVDPNDDNYI